MDNRTFAKVLLSLQSFGAIPRRVKINLYKWRNIMVQWGMIQGTKPSHPGYNGGFTVSSMLCKFGVHYWTAKQPVIFDCRQLSTHYP